MSPQQQAQAISDITGMCPKCDYVNDPKAMDEAENFLKPNQWIQYSKEMQSHGRSESFLRVFGKWIE